MKKDSIVQFNEQADHPAAVWCRENDINGKVIAEKFGMSELDVGLDYSVFAKEDQLIFVADDGEICKVPCELAATAPIPDVDDIGS